jgi:hypothetical protein
MRFRFIRLSLFISENAERTLPKHPCTRRPMHDILAPESHSQGPSMKASRIAEILEAKTYCGADFLDIDFGSACGADLMSDVMSFVKEKVVLLTGLVTPQAIRTADLLDIKLVVFVRGKSPTAEMMTMAGESGMILMSTKYSMFLACGRLYEAGLRFGGTREIQ